MKQYTAPQFEVVRMDRNDIIATSANVGFGDGSTSTMNGRADGDFFLWEE